MLSGFEAPDSKARQLCSLFVGDLSISCSDNHLRDLLGQYIDPAIISNVLIVRCRKTNTSLCYGFISFYSARMREDCDLLVTALNGMYFMGRNMKIRVSTETEALIGVSSTTTSISGTSKNSYNGSSEAGRIAIYINIEGTHKCNNRHINEENIRKIFELAPESLRRTTDEAGGSSMIASTDEGFSCSSTVESGASTAGGGDKLSVEATVSRGRGFIRDVSIRKLTTDKVTGCKQGYGFIFYDDSNEGLTAVNETLRLKSIVHAYSSPPAAPDSGRVTGKGGTKTTTANTTSPVVCATEDEDKANERMYPVIYSIQPTKELVATCMKSAEVDGSFLESIPQVDMSTGRNVDSRRGGGSVHKGSYSGGASNKRNGKAPSGGPHTGGGGGASTNSSSRPQPQPVNYGSKISNNNVSGALHFAAPPKPPYIADSAALGRNSVSEFDGGDLYSAKSPEVFHAPGARKQQHKSSDYREEARIFAVGSGQNPLLQNQFPSHRRVPQQQPRGYYAQQTMQVQTKHNHRTNQQNLRGNLAQSQHQRIQHGQQNQSYYAQFLNQKQTQQNPGLPNQRLQLQQLGLTQQRSMQPHIPRGSSYLPSYQDETTGSLGSRVIGEHCDPHASAQTYVDYRDQQQTVGAALRIQQHGQQYMQDRSSSPRSGDYTQQSHSPSCDKFDGDAYAGSPNSAFAMGGTSTTSQLLSNGTIIATSLTQDEHVTVQHQRTQQGAVDHQSFFIGPDQLTSSISASPSPFVVTTSIQAAASITATTSENDEEGDNSRSSPLNNISGSNTLN